MFETVELHAWIAKPGNLDRRAILELKNSATRKSQEVNAAGGNVLAQITGRYVESGIPKRSIKFIMYQMNLSKIWRIGRSFQS